MTVCLLVWTERIVIGISRWRQGVRRIRFFVARCVTHVTRLLHRLEVKGMSEEHLKAELERLRKENEALKRDRHPASA